MKKWTLLGLVAGLLVMWSGGAYSAGRGAVVSGYPKTDQDYGTTTIKLTLDGDSATSCGVDYRSDSAVFTPWVRVPVGIDFWIYTEVRDADSAKAFGPDTVHIGLFTAPLGSTAVDSLTIRHQNKQQLLWDYGSLNWRTFNQQTFFPIQLADTLAGDTVATAAASNKTGAFGGVTRRHNMGYLRFGLTMDDSDSLLDSGVRFNCFIVFKNPNYRWYRGSLDDENSYGNIEIPDRPSWAVAPKDERY